MTAQEIREKEFEKAIRGYKSDDVDGFLSLVSAQIENMANEKADVEKKLYLLAQKVEQYRSEEDMLKTAMINAQRMGESVVKEAKQKAESIIREADLKAALIEGQAKTKIEIKEKELLSLSEKVSKFKSDVLSIYKDHIQSLSELPSVPEREEIMEQNILEEPVEQIEEENMVIEPFNENVAQEYDETVEIVEEPSTDNGFDFEKASKMIENDVNDEEDAKTFEFEAVDEATEEISEDYTVPLFTKEQAEPVSKSEKSDDKNNMFSHYNKISFND